MINDFGKRKFKLWDYNISHGMALLRSPADINSRLEFNIDIIYIGVKYLSLPTNLGAITLSEPTDGEDEHLKKLLGETIDSDSIFVIQNDLSRFFIVAHDCQVQKNKLELFDYPYS